MQSGNERKEEILKDIIGTELYLKATEEAQISKDTLFNWYNQWYHQENREKYQFREKLQTVLENQEELIELTHEQIENLKQQIEQYKKVKKGVIQDQIFKQQPEEQE